MPPQVAQFDVDQLIDFWLKPGWVIYLIVMGSLFAALQARAKRPHDARARADGN